MPSSHILLLGAGFSRNWGAPLAGEVAGNLLQAIGSDAQLQALLKQHDKNFENALSEIQRQYLQSQNLPEVKQRFETLQGAITAMFDRLNLALERRTEFEFMNVVQYSVAGFLARFDAIFSLNQDLLLELRYAHHVLTASNTRWNGLVIPGMMPVLDSTILGIGDNNKRRWRPDTALFAVPPGSQPLFKLHGSSNWYTGDGRQLLVMGGDKEFMLREHQVLQWYYDEFKRRLTAGEVKLMVIGYSFSDRHINQVIIEAWQTGHLKGIFLVDPAGRYVLNPTPPHHIKLHSDLEDIPSLGASTRLISSTFAGDEFEHQKFMDFFRQGN
jgi:hypothetical protein